MKATIKVGSKVLWEGSFGSDDPEVAVIEDLERTEEECQKEGVSVKEASFVEGEWEFPFVCTLENGHWAYSRQIKPLNKEV